MSAAGAAVQQLPAEVWLHVFGFLSTADRLQVRTCCRFWKDLADQPSLWRHTTVLLAFGSSPCGRYNAQFWATLRRWKISSVEMQSTKLKDWKQLVQSLPALRSIEVDGIGVSQNILDLVKAFTDLKRLAVRERDEHGSVIFDGLSDSLTHLSICNFNLNSRQISQYKNLTSLVYHHNLGSGDPLDEFHTIIGSLPKLKHLSISVDREPWVVELYHPPPTVWKKPCASLTSLEIIDYSDPALPEDIMRSTPRLRRLALYCRHHTAGAKARHLKTWLSDLSELSELVLVRGPPPQEFIGSAPETVTSLTLRAGRITFPDMQATAARLPNLLRLHLDTWAALFIGPGTDRIPELFPKLRSIRIRHRGLPDMDLLGLHRLQNLERLEILDQPDIQQISAARQRLLELKRELQVLTNDRVKVVTPPFRRDPLTCHCPVTPSFWTDTVSITL